MIVADAVGDLEVVRRVEGDALVAARNRNRPDDLQILARRFQALHAGFLNQVDERRRAAVHDRHLGRVQLDHDVVDPRADEGGEQVLHRLHRHLVMRQARRQLDSSQVMHRRRHLVIAEVRTTKPDAEIGRGRFQGEVDLVAGMKTDSDTGNLTTNGTLCVH